MFRYLNTNGTPGIERPCKARLLRRLWLAAGLLCVGLAPLTGVRAGDAATDAAELEALMRQNVNPDERLGATVTSVGKRHQKLSETAAAVYVITQEDIRRSGATNIPDLLRMVPGLDVARVDSNKWAVSARGFNGRFANKLLVLMDGREVYSPTFGGVYWEVQDTPLFDIDRIEVIRGPGASLWGANAVNGVINIITKPASETLGGRLVAGGGSYEKGFGSFRYGHQFDEATAGRVWAQGFERGAFDNARNSSNHDSWSLARAGFRLDRDAQRGNAWLVEGGAYTGTIQHVLDLPMPQSPFHIPFGDRVAVSGFNLLGRWKTATSLTSEFTLQGFYDHAYRSELFMTQERDTLDLDLQHHALWWDHHHVGWGLGYRVIKERYGENEFVRFRNARASRQLFSAFVQDDIGLFDNAVTLTLGSKFQHNDFTGFEIQPSLRLAWNPDTQHMFWGALSRAVRTPSRVDTDMTLRGGSLLPGTRLNPSPLAALMTPVGSPNFQAERVIAGEFGYRFKPNAEVALDVALFYNDYTGLRGIDYSQPVIRLVDGPYPYWQVLGNIANSMTAQNYGMEWLLNWQIMEWWKTEFTYSYVETHFQSRRGVQNFSNENGYNPRHQASLRSSFDLARNLDLDLWLRYADRLPFSMMGKPYPVSVVPGYITMDARLAWRPVDGVELSLVGQNLLQGRRIEFDQEALGPLRSYVPRSFYLQLDWRF